MTHEELKQKRLAFLEETVAYYTEDPSRRAIDPNDLACRYRTDDGRKCAIGRHIPDVRYKSIMEGKTCTLAIVQEALPEDIALLGIGFLGSVQDWHDYTHNWQSTGLTEFGKKEIEEIKRTYELN